MENPHDTNFTVYIRRDGVQMGSPINVEQRLQSCSSYAEARAIQREYRRANQEVVIRFEGITGGGD